jgi:hypothetical protein
MSPRASAFLAMWHDIASEGETEYNNWHTREHMPERVGIPGFLAGRRYVDWSLERYRYFTIYDGLTLGTFNSPPYLERLNAPTPWSNRIQPHFRNFVRAACETVVSTGIGVGGALLTARLDFVEGEGAKDAFVTSVGEVAAKLNALHGVNRVLAGVVVPSITSVRTAETELRQSVQESVFDGAVLIEGIGRRELEDARTYVPDLLSEQTGVVRADVAIYDLAYLLTSDDTT